MPVSTTVDYAKMAELQANCTECTQMCNSTVLFVVTRKIGNILLCGDISNNVFRPLVPVSMRPEVISAVHNVAHPGVEATVRLVSAKFCWPKMAKQIRLLAQQCIACQKAKISTHVHLAPAAAQVRTSTCRFGRPTTHFCRIFLFVYGSRPDHSLARGDSHFRDFRRRVRRRPIYWLDSKVWSSCVHNFRSGSTIYIRTLGFPV